MKKTLWKDIFESISKSKGRFFSIMGLMMLGSFALVGLKVTGPDMRATGEHYFNQLNTADLTIIGDLGIDRSDQDIIDKTGGADEIEYGYLKDVVVKDTDTSFRIFSAPEKVSEYQVTDGRMPKQNDEIAVDSQYADTWKIGDTIKFTEKEDTAGNKALKVHKFNVVGHISSGELLSSVNLGQSTSGTGSLKGYAVVPAASFDSDVYMMARLTFDDTQGLDPYSDTYTDKLQAHKDELAEALKDQPQLRLAAVKGEYQEQIDEGQTAIDDAKQQLSDAQSQIDDAARRLADGSTEITDNEQKLKDQVSAAQGKIEDGESQISNAQGAISEAGQQLAAGKGQLDDGAAVLGDKWQQLQSAKGQLETAEATLKQAKDQLQTGSSAIESGRQQLTAGYQAASSSAEALSQAKQQLTAGQSALAQKKQEYSDGEAKYQAAAGGQQQNQTDLDAQKAKLDAAAAEISAAEKVLQSKQQEYDAGMQKLSAAQEKLAESEKLLKEKKAEYQAGLQQYNEGTAAYNKNRQLYYSGLEEWQQGAAQLNDKSAEYEENAARLAQAKQELAGKKAELAAGRSELAQQKASGEDQLARAKATLADKTAEYNKKNEEYLSKKSDAEKEIADKEDELSEAQETADHLQQPVYSLDSRRDIPGGNGYKVYSTVSWIIDALADVFPIFLYFVAALVTFSTIARFVEEERINTGTLKALGYEDRDIMKKFTFYGLVSSLSGAIIGIILGHTLLPMIVYNAYRIGFTLPRLELHIHWGVTVAALILAVLSAVLPAALAVAKELKEQPADLLLPKPPAAGSRIFLERIKPVWNHMSFTHKVTARNIFRYKTRMLMTIFGVAGAVSLLFAGLSVQYSISGINDRQFGDLIHYDIIAAKNDYVSDKQQDEIDRLLSAGTVSKSEPVYYEEMTKTAGKNKDNQSITLIAPESTDDVADYIDLVNRKSKEKLNLSGDGVIISERLSTLLKVKEGDTITLNDSTGTARKMKVDGITEMYMGHFVFTSKAGYEKIFGSDYKDNAYLVNLKNNSVKNTETEAAKFMDLAGIKGVVQNTTLTGQIDTIVHALDKIMKVLIVIAGLLGVVILYNLTNINVSERMRELSTIKVLGFYDKEVTMYIYRETIMLTILGIFAGYGIGQLLHEYIITVVPPDELMFNPALSATSFIIPAVIIAIITAVLGFVVNHRLKHVDMLEALKSVD